MSNDNVAPAPAPSPSAGSSPASPSASTQSAAPATVAPMPTTVPTTGEPPPERWEAILANARTKTRAEVEAEYREKSQWADQVRANPLALFDRLAQHPQYGPQLVAQAARLLNARRGQAAAAVQVDQEPEPDVPIVDQTGVVTGQTYSAQQLKKWREWEWAQREATISERFKPLEALRDQVEQATTRAQLTRESEAQAKTTLTELRQQPQFAAHEGAIRQALIDHEEWGDNIYRAYLHVLTTTILPTLSQTEQQQVLQSLQHKAAGATVNPGASSPTTIPRFFSKDGRPDFGKQAEWFEAHPEEAKAMAKL